MKNKTKRNILIAAGVILSIVFIILFVQMLGKAYRKDGYDFTSYLLSAKALLNGQNPYTVNTPFPYIYPLFLASVLTPFTFLPYGLNNVLWYFVNLGSFTFLLYLLIKQFNSPSRDVYLFVLFMTVLLIFCPLQNNLLNGQINFLVLLFCALFFYYFDSNNLLANLFLAIAISLKILPLVFLLFLLVEKKYKDIGLIILISFVFVFLLPGIFAGTRTIGYYSYYLNHFISESVSNTGSQSTRSIYFTLNGFLTSNFAGLRQYGLYLLIANALIILSPIVYLDVRLSAKNRPGRKLLMFSLYSLSLPLISPVSETHHLIFIIPALFLIIINIYKSRDRERKQFAFYYTLVFIIFWLGELNKFSPFVFLTLVTLLILMIVKQNKFRLTNEEI
jgi:hypothetical protein